MKASLAISYRNGPTSNDRKALQIFRRLIITCTRVHTLFNTTNQALDEFTANIPAKIASVSEETLD